MAPADVHGHHAVRFTQSGAHSRGHYSVVNTIRDFAQYCGISTMTEQVIPGTSHVTALRPADLLLSLEGKHLALDVTVVSPPLMPTPMATSLTGPPRVNAQMHYMDAAAKVNTLKYSLPCSTAGWTFSSVTCDTFGAMHSAARELVQHLIRRLRAEDHPSWATSPGAAVWRSESAAIISRAAQQYANAMAHYVSPTPASLLFDAQCAQEHHVHSSSATGTYTLAQPRPTTQPVGERVPLASPHSLRDFFGPDADGDIALDPATVSTAAGPTPSSAPPNPTPAPVNGSHITETKPCSWTVVMPSPMSDTDRTSHDTARRESLSAGRFTCRPRSTPPRGESGRPHACISRVPRGFQCRPGAARPARPYLSACVRAGRGAGGPAFLRQQQRQPEQPVFPNLARHQRSRQHCQHQNGIETRTLDICDSTTQHMTGSNPTSSPRTPL